MQVQRITLSLLFLSILAACSAKNDNTTPETSPSSSAAADHSSLPPEANGSGDQPVGEACSSNFLVDYNEVQLAKRNASDALNSSSLSDNQKRKKIRELQVNCQAFETAHGESSCIAIVQRQPRLISGSDFRLACDNADRFLEVDETDNTPTPLPAPAPPRPEPTGPIHADPVPVPPTHTDPVPPTRPEPRPEPRPDLNDDPAPPVHVDPVPSRPTESAPVSNDRSKLSAIDTDSIRVKLLDADKMRKLIANANLVILNGKIGGVRDFKEELDSDVPACLMFATGDRAVNQLDSGSEVKLFSKFERTSGAGGRELSLSISGGLVNIVCLRNTSKSFTMKELNNAVRGVVQFKR